MKFSEPIRISALLENYTGQWMIAGGWAIDLFLGKETRTHSDIEIAIPRLEQRKIQTYLRDWQLEYYKSGLATLWEEGVSLELPIHEVQGNHNGQTIEILFNEIEGEIWRFRRLLEIEYPKKKTILNSELNIPILCPEIVLLYKAKSAREKDTKDLLNAMRKMDKTSLIWLSHSIGQAHGFDHQWIPIIQEF